MLFPEVSSTTPHSCTWPETAVALWISLIAFARASGESEVKGWAAKT
jgi:hypothetical protein